LPLLFSVTLFLSAALLFCVQPMIAKLLLPKLGGSPAVWNTCMVVFQVLLLGGYTYAHALTRWLSVRGQVLLHAVALLLPLVVLPIGLPAGATETLPQTTTPLFWLLGVLLVAVGLPFFVTATSGPLLQKWFAGTGHASAHDPYFLYAASNLGSMIGLLGYPLVLEPLVPLSQQGWLWAAGYCALVVLVLLCAAALWRRGAVAGPSKTDLGPSEQIEPAPATRLTVGRRLRWVVLAFIPSSLMLGVTTFITTDIAALPLLWVIPLALYLLTFILTFAGRQVLPPKFVSRALPMLLVLMTMLLLDKTAWPAWLLIPPHLLTFFLAGIVCHGELARDRPTPRHLTEFYLWLSVGGALGGFFNALVAPLLFDPARLSAWFASVQVDTCPTRTGAYQYLAIGSVFSGSAWGERAGWPAAGMPYLIFNQVAEYPLVMALLCWWLPPRGPIMHTPLRRALDWLLPLALGGLVVALALATETLRREFRLLFAFVVYGAPAFLCFTFVERPVRFALGIAVVLLANTVTGALSKQTLYLERNFFGVVRVVREFGEQSHQLIHGNTLHGEQFLDPGRRSQATTYFHETGPLGQVFAVFQEKPARPAVGITGLGAGTIAAYARPGEAWTYYEIDPAVVKVARNADLFTYLRDCRATSLEVVLGDARLSLQEAPGGAYGLLIMDAFSSDSVPMHLITREALDLYVQKLAPGGLLVFNISNRYLDLEPALGALARAAGLIGLVRTDMPANVEEFRAWKKKGKLPSQWVVMARSAADLGSLTQDERWQALHDSDAPVWTDDFSNILSALFRN
jgi:spermidine synthase